MIGGCGVEGGVLVGTLVRNEKSFSFRKMGVLVDRHKVSTFIDVFWKPKAECIRMQCNKGSGHDDGPSRTV